MVNLIINNQIADVYDTGDLLSAVTYSIGDIADLESKKNPTTKTIKIPATAKNRRIFGHPEDVTVTSFLGQKTLIPGSIVEGGTEILSGVVNLKAAQLDGENTYYEITIIGSGGEWIAAMASPLRSCGTDGQHTLNNSSLSAAWDASLAYGYTPVNNGYHGRGYKVTSVEDDGTGRMKCWLEGTSSIFRLHNALAGTVDGGGFKLKAYNKRHTIHQVASDIYFRHYVILTTPFAGDDSGALRATGNYLGYEDLSLIINVKSLFAKLFNDCGYRISSDFTDDDFFERLWMLPGTFRRLPGFIADNSATAGLSADVTYIDINYYSPLIAFNTILSGSSLVFDESTGEYVASDYMLVKFKASLNIRGSDGLPVLIMFFVNSTAQLGTNRNTETIDLSPTDYAILEQEAELRLHTGDRVGIKVYFPDQYGYVDISSDSTSFECIPDDRFIEGSTVTPYDCLPDIKQIDFVKAIRHLFNLHFYTDVNMKTVYVEPRDTFYMRDKYLDLTEKMDISKVITVEEMGADSSKRLTFRYKEDTADTGLKRWEEQENTSLGVYTAEIENRFASSDEKKIENPLFAPTLMAPYPGAGLPKSYLPKIWGDIVENDTYPEVLKEYAPRILYFAGMRDVKTGESFAVLGGSSPASASEYPLFCSYDQDTVNDYSLLFNPQPGQRDLYSRFYANHVRTINEARKVTAFFNLTVNDIQSLSVPDPTGGIVKDFRSQVLIRRGGEIIPCRLNEVTDYVAGKNTSTKCILVTDVDNIAGLTTPFYTAMVFTNNSLAIGQPYAPGSIVRTGSVWADVRSGNKGNYMGQTTSIGVGSSYPGFYKIERLFLYFDTSLLPNSCTIVEAYLDIYKVGGDTSQEIAVYQGTQANTLTVNDYPKFGVVKFGESSPGVLGLRRIYLNASGIASINKTGWTKFCLRERYYDVYNVPPASNFFTFKTHMISAPAAYLNKLTIKYSD